MFQLLNEEEAKAVEGRFNFDIDLPNDYDERVFSQEMSLPLQSKILKEVRSIETLEKDVWVHRFAPDIGIIYVPIKGLECRVIVKEEELEIGMLYILHQKMEYKAIVKNDELVVEETAFIAVSKLIRKHIIHGSGWCGFRSGYSVDGYRFKMIIHNEGFDEIIFEKNSRRVVVVLCNYNPEKSVVKIC